MRVSALGASSLLDCYSVDTQLAQLRPQNFRELYARCASNQHKHWVKPISTKRHVMSAQADFHSLPQGHGRASPPSLLVAAFYKYLIINKLSERVDSSPASFVPTDIYLHGTFRVLQFISAQRTHCQFKESLNHHRVLIALEARCSRQAVYRTS